jgi:hypothetical protein
MVAIATASAALAGAPLSPEGWPNSNAAKQQKSQAPYSVIDAESIGPRSDAVAIRRRVIIRIPVLEDPAPPPAAFAAPRGKPERKPQCLSLRLVRGATVNVKEGISFLMLTTAGGYRAGLERGCSPAFFQSGFYIDPPGDGQLCSGRDLLHARSGAACMITGFSYQKPRK